MKLAIMILARNEEKNIGSFLESLASQSLFDRADLEVLLFVGANGCSDRTAQVARDSASKSLRRRGVTAEIFDWAMPGKSRSWNRLVHEILPQDVDYILAMDADIELADHSVLAAMFDRMSSDVGLEVVSGFPVKDVAHEARPTLIDRFSLRISGLTRHSGSINGSLYLAKASCLSEIWLPDETPGEDGFLNAMVMTRGFSRPEERDVVYQMHAPTHYFESHSAASYFAHEKRMIVGTMINRWIFEYLHSLRLSEPAGRLIERLNREQPNWVEKIIAERSGGKWLIPKDLLFRRLVPKRRLSMSYLLKLPILVMATALTFPPALDANKALKKRGASSMW